MLVKRGQVSVTVILIILCENIFASYILNISFEITHMSVLQIFIDKSLVSQN